MLHLLNKILKKFANDKNYRQTRDHSPSTGKHRGTAHSICNLRFNVPSKIPIVFRKGSNYDLHFTIKELASTSEGQVEYLGEKTEKYKTFSIPIRIYKYW